VRVDEPEIERFTGKLKIAGDMRPFIKMKVLFNIG